tara:strand:- start:3221 stop:5299 length:2079 start_codon:yes stop_codon:yes gene_type:complete
VICVAEENIVPNKLVNETSPYLLQHANNPVDWLPWGNEALELAKTQDLPILLSVGYSACHWCHVMERESFENPDIAKLMNDNFVCIKVDREERPDIDSIYMSAVQVMTGQGGWPMTVFLTPEAKPFYGGTYFPPEDRGGLPSFPKLLTSLSLAYREKKSEILEATEQLFKRIEGISSGFGEGTELDVVILDKAQQKILEQFDHQNGGTGLQPKFPQPVTYEFLLRHYARFGNFQSLEIVEKTLTKMAQGGIHDQIGGGFHRYSTDTYWLVPHFEKMLYDNALLVQLYLHAYQITGDAYYREVVERTLGYVSREMTGPQGEFYSSQDADSEGVEGKFFVWRPEQIRQILGNQQGEIFNDYYGVTKEGNFEGMSILHVASNCRDIAQKYGTTEKYVNSSLEKSREILLEHRNHRIAPDLDDKVISSWNGMMLRSYAEAGAVFGHSEYLDKANQNAKFISDNLISDGRLLRTYRDGQSNLKAYLEDYAFVIDGFLSLHQATLDPKWIHQSMSLCESMMELFWDDESECFYDTGIDHEELFIRPKDYMDNAIPSGSSMASDVILRIAIITGDMSLRTKSEKIVRSFTELMTRFPAASGKWLSALDFILDTPKEIAIVGNVEEEGTVGLLAAVSKNYIPNKVVVGSSGYSLEPNSISIPLLQNKCEIDGKPAAYVCENYVCMLPVTDPIELTNQLID